MTTFCDAGLREVESPLLLNLHHRTLSFIATVEWNEESLTYRVFQKSGTLVLILR